MEDGFYLQKSYLSASYMGTLISILFSLEHVSILISNQPEMIKSLPLLAHYRS